MGAGSRRRETDIAFAPPAAGWRPVSPRLATVWRIVLLLCALPIAAVAVILAVQSGMPDTVRAAAIAVLAAGIIVVAWAWIALGRRVRSYGYAERADDLLVVRGIIVRRLVIVPYGRMQMVDVRAGPLDRRFGIATVQVHTAAATTDAAIPGLSPGEAAALRDRLTVLGEERSAGL